MRGELMKKIIRDVILIVGLIVYFYFMCIVRKWYFFDMSYLKGIILILLISLMIFSYGIVENKESTYKNNVNLYIALYCIILISVTFFIGRARLKFYNWWTIQDKLFYTIMFQIKYGTMRKILKNVICNIVMLIPLSFLLMIKDKKYNNVLNQTIIILPIIIGIELLQGFTHVGTCDIDDVILNYFGTVVFTFLITRFKIIDRIRNIFYSDYKLKKNIKNSLFYISIFLVVFYIFRLIVF